MKYIKFVKSVGSLAQTDSCMDPNQYRTEKRETGQNVMNKTCFVSLSKNQMAERNHIFGYPFVVIPGHLD